VIRSHTRWLLEFEGFFDDRLHLRRRDCALELVALKKREISRIALLEGHSNWVNGATQIYHRRILTWSRDGTLRIWSREGCLIAVLVGHTSSVEGANLTLDGRIISWSTDHTLRIWTQDGSLTLVFDIRAAYVGSDTRLSDDLVLSWHDTDHGRELRLRYRESYFATLWAGHTGRLNGIMQLSDGRILSWSDDRSLRIWDEDGNPIAVLEGHTEAILDAKELPDGRIVSRSSDSVRLWGKDGSPVTAAAAELGPDAAFEASPKVLPSREDDAVTFEGDPAAKSTELSDGRILSWSDANLRMLARGFAPTNRLQTESHTDQVTGIGILSDGRILSWSRDGTLRIWTKEGSPVAVLEGHTKSVSGARELPDGRVLSWSRDATLRIWDKDGSPAAVLQGHTESIQDAIVLSDGRIMSWSDDKCLRIWNERGDLLVVLDGHPRVVRDVLELCDGRILSCCRRIQCLWDQEGNLLAKYKRSLPRALRAEKERCSETRPPPFRWRRSIYDCRNDGLFVELPTRSPNDAMSTNAPWHSRSLIGPVAAIDGTLVVTLESGEVLYLELFRGSERVALGGLATPTKR
jgi:WD40 repeat protein